MVSATAQPTAPRNGTAAGTPPPLWGDIEIPIIVATGEFGQGKTLGGLTICPGPQTLVLDNEGSSLTYRSLDFDHVDMAAELNAKHPKGYTASDRYTWFREEAIRRGKAGGRAGKYRVLVVDPASEIEDGMADYIKANITKYGLTQAQADRSPALFWGVMKREWKALLDQLRVLYETVYITVHLRDEFKGGAPTGKREPKGKETLFELASLFLWFEREKSANGTVAAVPSANVLKSRLAKTLFVDGELNIVPVLPPRLPVATPKAIREYIATPPDYDHLKKAERVHEKTLTEDEKLLIQSQIAANQAIAAQAESSRMEKMAMAAKAQAEAAAAARPAPDLSHEVAASRAESTAASVPPPASPEIVVELQQLVADAFATLEDAKATMPALLTAFGVGRIAELNQTAAENLRIELMQRKSIELQRRAAEKLAASGTTATVQQQPNDPTEPSPQSPPRIDDATASAIRGALGAAYEGDQDGVAKFAALLAQFNAAKIVELSQPAGAMVLAELNRLASVRATAAAEAAVIASQPAAGPAASAAGPSHEMLMALRKKCEELKPNGEQKMPYDQQNKWLKERGLGSFRSLSDEQIFALIEQIEEESKAPF